MKVVILCGGQGTRLREETEHRPKAMVDVGGRPILWHLMKIYAHHGFRDFVLCLGYRGHMIKEYFLNYEALNNDFTISLGKKHELAFHGAHDEQDFRVTLAETGAETETGGRLKRVQRYVEDDTFMLTYGDGVSDIDLKELLAFHQDHGKLATMTAVHPVSRHGVLELDSNGRIRRFAEKPQQEGWVNAGFMVLSKKVFDYIGGDETVLEREPLVRLVKEGQLMAFRHPGSFHSMDTYREYLQLNAIWNTGKVPWKVWK